MNEFDKQKNALRIQFKAEQRQITKDCYRTISRINKDLGQVNSQEAREALRTEKERVYETMRRTHELNKTCYLQQLDLLDEQYFKHLERHPSKTHIKSILAAFCRSAEADDLKNLSIHFAKNRIAKIHFSLDS